MSHDVAVSPARRRRRAQARLAVAGACGLLLAHAAGAAAAERAYELVSPPDKGNGGIVLGLRAADDGDGLAYYLNSVTGPLDSAYQTVPFVSRRTDAGWAARSAAPAVQAEHRGSGDVRGWFREANEDFSKVYIFTNDNIDPADREPLVDGSLSWGWDVYRFDPETRAAEWISRPTPAVASEYGAGGTGPPSWTNYIASTADGEHVLYLNDRRTLPEANPGGVVSLYEVAGGEVRLVGILPDGRIAAGDVRPAYGLLQPLTNWARQRNVMSQDGSRIYWVANGRLYLREDGERTLPVSVSQRTGTEGTMAPGTFAGMTPDGASAFFFSSAQLTNDAPPLGEDALYRWDRDTESLTFLVQVTSPLAPDGEYAPWITESADRIHFYAGGVHAAGAEANARNLYLWDGELRFVATTPVDAPRSDPRLRVSDDGRYAVFTSNEPIDPSYARVHPAGVNAIYRYDAETGRTECVSCRADGRASRSDELLRPTVARYSAGIVNQSYAQPRNMTADGRSVYFQTAEALVPEDMNGNLDVYGFENGRHTLISNGRGLGAEIIDNSDDGSTVFFMTGESLVGRDVDGGYPDAYAARVGGGFPDPPPPALGCQGDNCQGAPTPLPLFGTPGSALVDPDDSADDPEPTTVSFRSLRPTARQLRTFARSGTIVLRVRVGAPGSVLVAARGRIGRRERELGRAWKSAARAGTVRVAVPLNALARRQLASGRALRVTATVEHSRAEQPATISLRLRRSVSPARRTSRTNARRTGAGR